MGIFQNFPLFWIVQSKGTGTGKKIVSTPGPFWGGVVGGGGGLDGLKNRSLCKLL